MERKVYETERLELKVLDPSDAQLVLEYYIRNAAFLEEWEPSRGAEFYAKQYHQKQLDDERAMMEAGSMLRLWIFKKGEENRAIGSIGFSNIVRGIFLSCYLGYRLDGEEINKGYITEALRKSIEIIFDEYGLHRIEANIMPRNARSLRVTEKLGFINEGTSPRYLKINGIWEDHIHMVLLNDKL